MRYHFAAIVILITCFIQVSSAQNVGIGTTTLIARLHVADSNVLFPGPASIPSNTTYYPPAQGAGEIGETTSDKLNEVLKELGAFDEAENEIEIPKNKISALTNLLYKIQNKSKGKMQQLKIKKE